MPSLRSRLWSLGLRRTQERYQPAADNGFFGPGSVTWKVWTYPSSILCGFQRAVTIEQLDPHLNAAVEQSGGVRYRPRTRYERTVNYFALVAFGDSKTTAKAADVLVRVHSKAVGTDPVSGRTYDANDPDSQLWIHVTAWHSILYCYETMGPGQLSDAEERQYWSECARAAECQTIDPAKVPRSRDEVRAYFASWRPRLAASELAQSMTDFILHTENALFPDAPTWAKPAQIAIARLVGLATVSTYPRYMRKLFGIRQSTATDVLVQTLFRAVHRAIASNPVLYEGAARAVIPKAMPIIGPVLFGIPASSSVTMRPREAQARYGFAIPAEAHRDFRDQQKQRVFGKGQAPSDQGLEESVEYFGAMA